jgi:hypothetical protein
LISRFKVALTNATKVPGPSDPKNIVATLRTQIPKLTIVSILDFNTLLSPVLFARIYKIHLQFQLLECAYFPENLENPAISRILCTKFSMPRS